MTAKEFVDALENDSNLEAEDAFKNAMSQKVGDALETKRKEIFSPLEIKLEMVVVQIPK